MNGEVLDFDCKLAPMLYNAYGVEGEPMPEFDFPVSQDSNLRPVLLTPKKININTRLPEYLRFLSEDLG